jgi:hypothetical protein
MGIKNRKIGQCKADDPVAVGNLCIATDNVH